MSWGWKRHSTFEELNEGQRVRRSWVLSGNEISMECFKKRCGRIELCLGCREGADSRSREQVADQLGDAHGSQAEGEGLGPRGGG